MAVNWSSNRANFCTASPASPPLALLLGLALKKASLITMIAQMCISSLYLLTVAVRCVRVP